MLEVMLFGKKTQEKCGNILKKQIPASLAAGKNYGKLPSSLLRQIARRDEFILLHRPEPEEYWCIFDASQEGVTRMAQRNHLRTLTCGFSPYDTLVLSGMSLDQAVVSLQREIHTVSDRLLEPGDYVIHCSGASDDPALLLCTATLLMSDRDRDNHVFYF
ncbi:MAG: hypothetical protein ACI4L5_03415 [Negativibacillus sp.]